MVLDTFRLILEHPVYYGGQTIAGKLIINIDKPLQMRAISLKFFGECDIHWSEGGGNSRRHYYNKEKYIDVDQLVFGGGDHDEDCELLDGQHVFLFNHLLPLNLPTSFEGRDGQIRYYVKATIKRNWKLNYTTTEPFTVLEVLDLNTSFLVASPIKEQASKTFWGDSNPFSMSVELPVQGFVPGQMIPIKVTLNNESEVQVGKVIVALKQVATFHAKKHSRDHKKCIFQNEYRIQNCCGREEMSLNPILPALPPSNLGFCKIIDLEYKLDVTAKVNVWYHKNLSISVKLIVGNVPLLSYQATRPSPIGFTIPQLDHTPPDSENYSSPDYLPPTYYLVIPPFCATYGQQFPLPTYEQSVAHGEIPKEQEKDHSNNDGVTKKFIPHYPFFRFENVSGADIQP